METPDLELIYVGDPMCSWCWGFAPAMEAVVKRYSFPVSIVVGGLRPGPAAELMDAEMKRYLAHHWHQVEETTGQGFDHEFFQRDGWTYDTELPCIATVTMRTLAPDAVHAFYAKLQRAFYASNVDITDVAVYPQLLEETPVDADLFIEEMQSSDMRKATYADFSRARSLGANGFPTLLLRDGLDHYMVARGYVPFDQLDGALTGWIESHHPTAADSLVVTI
ncbi:MAG: DsbA family protein [Acidimicrobiia bacterium]|nr:DsbA family protein [Acidimicrobiia bacterium]NNF63054.1 DsbA family protein [Acidimicrobiia bacterium]